MENKTTTDAQINRNTLKKMLEPIIEFIIEHKDKEDRGILFSQCISILKGSVKLTPTDVCGTLFAEAWTTLYASMKQAEMCSKLDINVIRD